MVRMRKVSKEKYIVAGLITGGIFILGLLLGFVIEGKRVGYIEEISKEQNLDFSSLQLQYAYIDQLSQENNCEAVSRTFEKSIESLEATRSRLENFDESAQLNRQEFDLLKREYTLAQIRYWLLAKKTKELCGDELVTVLYFFSDERECSQCNNQAFSLTYLKKRFREKLLIFSFDSKFEDEPLISILKSSYEISRFPTLVIEGEKFEGFTETEKILESICPYYSSEIKECEEYV
jgi:lysyl-tRNA synthetase class II